MEAVSKDRDGIQLEDKVPDILRLHLGQHSMKYRNILTVQIVATALAVKKKSKLSNLGKSLSSAEDLGAGVETDSGLWVK